MLRCLSAASRSSRSEVLLRKILLNIEQDEDNEVSSARKI
jgi:hypothetical protein